MKTLLGLDTAELTEVALAAGLPKFTGKQMAQWIYGKRVKDIASMTNISAAGRKALAEMCTIGAEPPVHAQRSADGTVKYLFPVGDGKHVETVYPKIRNYHPIHD